MDGLIEAYCAAWNEDDPGQRAQMLEAVCHPEVVYVDPRIRTAGVPELVAYITQVRSHFAGAQIAIVSVLDAHHRWVRFAWRLVNADRSTLPESLDICEVADGRLMRVIGFFGPLSSK